MATVTATAASSIVSPRLVHAGAYSITGGPFSLAGSSGDVIKMIKVPNGFKVKEVVARAAVTPLSAGGTTAYTFLVGDGGDDNRFISASISAAAMTRLGAGITTEPFYTYTANDTIDVTISAVSGTDSASQTVTLTLVAFGTIDD